MHIELAPQDEDSSYASRQLVTHNLFAGNHMHSDIVGHELIAGAFWKAKRGQELMHCERHSDHMQFGSWMQVPSVEY